MARSNGSLIGRSNRGDKIQVCVSLEQTYSQATANRLSRLGLEVEESLGGEIIGLFPPSKLQLLKDDVDVKNVDAAI